MSIDVPLVVYEKDNKSHHSRSAMDELADKWHEQKMRSPVQKGEKIKLSDYMNKKI